ncbi:TRAP transporter large permease [uncultured Dysosmobacter sp.]|uniref:TRAP transporter large permease n=1 Tax=uncultured Dysosmobacter sp. TaxID=2591384 RepID=UPI0026108D1F|nr:TRAP transporter large permease [uncultured Dysosmobacter sp.]
MNALLLFLMFFALLFVGAPIALALGGSSLLYLLFIAHMSPVVVFQQMLSGVNSFTLLAVPLFMMAGSLMEHGGISKRLVSFAMSLVGHFTGGLAMVVIVASVFFAAMSGSAVATTAAIGAIMIPAMYERGYDKDYACALQATGGIFGPLIPPSIAMVLYAVTANQSVSTMLIAGAGPGLFMASLVIIYVIYSCHKRGFRGQDSFSAANVWTNFKDAIWALLSPLIILGGIYSGIFTPTESAAIACTYSILVGVFVYKEMDFRQLFSCLSSSIRSTGGIMMIVAGASTFSWVLTRERMASSLANAMLSVSDSRYWFIFCTLVVLLIAGCFIDAAPAVMILTPIFAPIAQQYGVSLIHLGGYMICATSIGNITPPMGLNLFMASQVGKRPVHRVIKEIWPFIGITVLSLLLVALVPQITTFLPGLMK